jgi:hypothetical protein
MQAPTAGTKPKSFKDIYDGIARSPHTMWIVVLIVLVLVIMVIVISAKVFKSGMFDYAYGAEYYKPGVGQTSGEQTGVAFATAFGTPGLEGVSAVQTLGIDGQAEARLARDARFGVQVQKKSPMRSNLAVNIPITGTALDSLACGNMAFQLSPDKKAITDVSSNWDYDAAAQAYSLQRMGMLPRGPILTDKLMYHNLNAVKAQIDAELAAGAAPSNTPPRPTQADASAQ